MLDEKIEKLLTRGEVVVHPRRPEWGEGTVDSAVSIVHEGRQAQRLIVSFVNHGRVTINTGVAPLVRKEAYASMSSTTTPFPSPRTTTAATRAPESQGTGWLASLGEKPGNGEHLYRLPDAMTDPFAGLGKRLQETLDSYRFSTDARGLIEWGIAQTGLSDPLSKHTRHELEQAFPRFARDRDNHLFELVRAIKRQGKSEILQQAMQDTRNPTARNALQKAMRS